jgi:hypothetical protein
MAEMNQQVLGNLDRIITALEAEDARPRRRPMRAGNSQHLAATARRRGPTPATVPSGRYGA